MGWEQTPDFTRVRRLQILPGDGDPIFPASSQQAPDKQLTGNFLRSDINRDSQVPLIQTDIACELGLTNFEKSVNTCKAGLWEGTHVCSMGMCEMWTHESRRQYWRLVGIIEHCTPLSQEAALFYLGKGGWGSRRRNWDTSFFSREAEQFTASSHTTGTEWESPRERSPWPRAARLATYDLFLMQDTTLMVKMILPKRWLRRMPQWKYNPH